MAKKPMSKAMQAFERSGRDNDKGVKEGSAADKARDKKEFAAFQKARKAKPAGKPGRK